METFSLPGFDVEELLGFGGCGEVWRARSQATGELVALKRLRVGRSRLDADADADAERELRRAAALLVTARHEHVVRLRATVPTSSALVLVFDHAAGGSLASLLATRGALTAGEVVALVAPLAVALGEMHARGFVHGNITPANVLFDAAGRPLLADLGVAGLMRQAGEPVRVMPGFADPAGSDGVSVAAADVHGLGAICHAALSGSAPYRDAVLAPLRAVVSGVPPTLVEAVEAAMNVEFRARPDAAAFARALYAAATPRPVRLAAPPAPPAEREPGPGTGCEPTPPAVAVAVPVTPSQAECGSRVPRHVRARGGNASRLVARRLAMPLTAAGLLAAAVFVGVTWAGHDRPAAASAQRADGAASSESSESSWARVLGALDAARDQAFADGDPDELTGVYVAGSAALAADRQTLATMENSGQRAQDLALKLVSVVVQSQTPTSVTLLVRDTLPPYEIVGPGGDVQRQPGRGERAWLVTLRATSAGGTWRVAAIDAA